MTSAQCAPKTHLASPKHQSDSLLTDNISLPPMSKRSADESGLVAHSRHEALLDPTPAPAVALKSARVGSQAHNVLGIGTSAATSFSHVVLEPQSATGPVPISFNDIALENPAKVYPFQLDTFQREAVICLEKNQNVLVAAHTSAGKTAVAEYAIAMAMRDKQRVLYTSPIKALSNQKYREFHEEFHDVGLMTGDVNLTPNASCLVMTTEILRNMLFRGSEVLREVSFIIFDEVHYMRDLERGVVWEESIILLPPNITLVFLSATIANAIEFAEWVCWLKNKTCHVISTDFRPTPLQHYVFPPHGEGLYLVKDGNSPFRFDRFEEVLKSIDQSSSSSSSVIVHNEHVKRESDIHRLVRLLMEGQYNPAIFFSFSRAECESLALQLGNVSLSSPEERAAVDEVWLNGIEGLTEEDRNLPQIASMLPLLQRGIGVHHSGLLPVLKEIVEILFGEGLIKILFATETFAMGVNMPAKTVVFTNTTKFDGVSMRCMHSNEYIQMSGRAGRRGIDARGICVIMIDQRSSADEISEMVGGSAAPLQSQFRLSYHTLLNLLRLARADVDVADPKRILEKSFYFFQRHHILPKLRKRITNLEEIQRKRKELIGLSRMPSVSSYSYLIQAELRLTRSLHHAILWPQVLLPLLQPGRVIRVYTSENAMRIQRHVRARASLTEQVKKDALIEKVKFLLDVKPIISSTTSASSASSTSSNPELDISEFHSKDANSDSDSDDDGDEPNPYNPSEDPDEISPTSNSASAANEIEVDPDLIGLGIDDEEADEDVVDSDHWATDEKGFGILTEELDDEEDVDELDGDDDDSGTFNMDLDEESLAAASERKRKLLKLQKSKRRIWDWGILIGISRRFNSVDGLVLDVLLPCQMSTVNGIPYPEPAFSSSAPNQPAVSYEIVRISTSMVESMSVCRLYLTGYGDLRSPSAKQQLYQAMLKSFQSFPQTQRPPVIRPTIELFSQVLSSSSSTASLSESTPPQSVFNSATFVRPSPEAIAQLPNAISRLEFLRHRIASHSLSSSSADSQRLAVEFEKYSAVESKLAKLKHHLRTHVSTGVFELEFKARKRVLRRLGHIDQDGLLLTKGRVAAEIEAVDELVITELIFEGFFNSMDCPTVAATVACMLEVEKVNQLPNLSPSLKVCLETVQTAARRIAEVCVQCKVNIDVTKFVGKFKPQLMPLMHAWCSGKNFSALCEQTTMFEGSLTRHIRRLEEVLRQLSEAARSIGNSELETKFEETMKSLKRGLPFAASLYI